MTPIVSPYKTFRFVAYTFDRGTGEAALTYAIDGVYTFTEKVVFPLPEKIAASDEAIDHAVRALHLIGGISYYKAYLPPEIVVESTELTKDEAVFWAKLYTLGLGEFFYRNNLDFQGYVRFPATDVATSTLPKTTTSGAVLPLGGGKDSLVAVEMLRKAGKPFDLLALRAHERIVQVAEAVGQPLAVIGRQIDPQLFELNKKGAWNGHVPITAYVAFASVVYALLHGKQDIIFANEKSANNGNVTVHGVSINHQYSKSLEAERDIQNYLAMSVTADVRVFSLLRPLSELAITKRFAERGKYLEIFSSCNKNFRITGDKPVERWCGECPKCAFVFSMLAAFVPQERLVKMFGKNLYDDGALLWLYKELLALEGIKPFECVGEPDEVFAAFVLAHRRGDFAGSVIMDWFVREVLPTRNDVDEVIAASLAMSNEHAMPEEYANIIYAS